MPYYLNVQKYTDHVFDLVEYCYKKRECGLDDDGEWILATSPITVAWLGRTLLDYMLKEDESREPLIPLPFEGVLADDYGYIVWKD